MSLPQNPAKLACPFLLPMPGVNEAEYYYADTGVLDCEAVVAANGWQLQSGNVAAEPCGQTTAHATQTKYRDEYIRTRDDVLYTVTGPIEIYNDHVVSCT